jgi:tRNA 2-thiouridine synthesizing protein A
VRFKVQKPNFFNLSPRTLFNMIKETLNARRLLCPLPVIRTQDKVKQLKSGDQLEVVCTDPGVMQDIPAWCRINGHKVLETITKNHEYIIILEVGA